MSRYQRYWKREQELHAELEAIETQAGVRDKIAAFVEYNGPSDFRRVYFGVPDKELRKALITKYREIRQEHADNYYQTKIADNKEILNATRQKGIALPWKMPSLLACVVIAIGYFIWSIPGALAGTLLGFFLGQAQVSRHKAFYTEIVKNLEEEIRELEMWHKITQRKSETFSAAEEESGCEDKSGHEPVILLA